MKIFMSSHGHMASGMMSTLKVLYGCSPDITVFDAYIDEYSVQEKLEAFFSGIKDDEEVLLLSDLYGSSVNQAMYHWLTRPHTRLVTGINLAFLIGLAGHESINDEELKELIEESRTMLRQVTLEEETGDKEDDFF